MRCKSRQSDAEVNHDPLAKSRATRVSIRPIWVHRMGPVCRRATRRRHMAAMEPQHQPVQVSHDGSPKRRTTFGYGAISFGQIRSRLFFFSDSHNYITFSRDIEFLDAFDFGNLFGQLFGSLELVHNNLLLNDHKDGLSDPVNRERCR